MSAKRRKTEHPHNSVHSMSGNSAAYQPKEAEFHGQGIQNTGSIHVGRDVNIAAINRPRDDKTRIEQQKGGLLHDSYKWILSHKDFRQWRDGDENQLLWIRGDPGKGKTMLLCGIINELGMKDRNVAYYFCQAANDKLHKATSVLQGLMFSLLSQRRELLESVQEEIDEASREMFQDMNGWAALCRIFGRLIEQVERRQQTTYLIVDALDECLEGQQNLLKWIADLSSSRIKMLVSSRNWPSIESGLSSATQKVLLHLELNPDSISTAVDSYIDYKAAKLATSKDLDTETREAVQRHLKSNSSNTFLWVALVCQNLGRDDTEPWNVLDMLHGFPPGLDELYERMASQFLTSKNAEMCCRVLAVQTLVYRPLGLKELLSLTELPGNFSERWLRKVVELCGSFLTVKDDTIYFVHQSAKDYLVEHMLDSIFHQRLLAGHHTIFVQSIQGLSQTLRKNVYQLPSLGSRIESIEVPNPDPLNGIRYACVYWVDHLENAKLIATESQDLQDGGLVHTFLETHLLHWLEALSLLKRPELSIVALTKLLSLLQENKQDEKDLGKLVYDAMRFSRYHKTAFEAAPLQVYGPGLVFSPTRSVVRKLFLKKKPEWLLMSPTRESDWSTCLQTLEGHRKRIKSVAFSPNGRHLVSGSDDSTARIWDVATGGCLNILEGHRHWIDSVALSPNGRFIASSSLDRTIRIWDATTGLCLQILDTTLSGNRGSEVTTGLVSFPDDESVTLVPANLRGRICTWNIAPGKILQTVQIRNSINGSACISGNGTRVAWIAKSKGRVEVVDLVAGQYHRTPWHKDVTSGIPYPVISAAALSPGGEYVAVGAPCDEHNKDRPSFGYCWRIQVWILATDECIRTVHFWQETRMIWELALALALSPNARFLVASGPGSGGVEWDVSTGQQVSITRELYRAYDFIHLIKFSPDSKLLVSTEGSEIRIWDMTLARLQHRTSGKLQYNDNQVLQDMPKDEFRIMDLSPDDKLLGFLYKEHFQTWDTTKNECLSTIKGHWFRAKFSSDSRHVACVHHSNANTEDHVIIEFFDGITGRSLWRSSTGYKSNFGEWSDNLAIFSADGRRLASGFRNQFYRGKDCDIVQVLDTATGMCVSTFPTANPDESRLMALSPEGTKAVTLFMKKYLQIWDIATGSRIHSIVLPSHAIPQLKSFLGSFESTFSPDGRYLAYHRMPDDIWIFDVATGTALKHLERVCVGRLFCCGMRWELAGLLTGRGIYNTHVLLDETKDSIKYGYHDIPAGTLSGMGLSLDKSWILKNGECYIWIPPEIRTRFKYTSPALSGNTIAFSDTAGGIYCIRLPEDGLER